MGLELLDGSSMELLLFPLLPEEDGEEFMLTGGASGGR